jgi:hypothetical protein
VSLPRTRRSVLLAASALVAGLAGCQSDGADEDGSEDGTPTDDADGGSPPEAGGGGTATDSGGDGEDSLDLQEANVVDVDFEAEGGSYRFDVALHHDDGGEDGYANWWQVETLDGERLGRRDLLHPHSQQPFTRSETISVPDDTTCVVVRGHDETHDYGGQALLVDLASGDTRSVRQGGESRSFTAEDCP